MKAQYKVVVLAGGRPDFARLTPLIKTLDKSGVIDCILINSGQHSHTDVLDQSFRKNLGLREPDYNLEIGIDGADWYQQIALIFEKLTPLLKEIKPDAFVNLGDMNPCLSGLVAKRLGIPYIRIECAMRSGTVETAYKNFDLPEEINRVAMDSIADLKLVYMHDYTHHLIREGHMPDSIKVVGNTIIDALDYYTKEWNIETVQGGYDLATFHRGNNMNEANLRYFWSLIDNLARRFYRNIKFICYGRTRKELERLNLMRFAPNIEVLDSQNNEDFLRLVAGCDVILSDSGSTSSEESHYFHKPCLILRDSTERPTTLIDNNPEDGNAYLWTMDLVEDLHLYERLSSLSRTWNNRYYGSPTPYTVSHNIHKEIVRFLNKGGV
jgi:UDP-N-acetylglucosamine 2-epimerase (non-hydrolysing)